MVFSKQPCQRTKKPHILFLLFAITFFSVMPANAFAAEDLTVLHASETDYLATNSPFVLLFNQTIQIPDPTKIHLNKGSDPISVQATANGKKLVIKADAPLEPNQRYTVKIDPEAIKNGDGSLSFPKAGEPAKTYTFSTNTLSLSEAIGKNAFVLDDIIDEYYTFKNIFVTAPKNYIREMEVYHKKPGKLTEATNEKQESGALTNVDLEFDGLGTDVKLVKVELIVNGTTKQEKTLTHFDSQTINVAFTNLTDPSFDVKVTAYADVNEEQQIDLRMLPIPQSTESIVRVSSRFSSKTAGKTYSLYELLTKSSTFRSLLQDSDMDLIQTQVVETE